MNRRAFLKAGTMVGFGVASGLYSNLLRADSETGSLIPPQYQKAIQDRLRWVDQQVAQGPYLPKWDSLFLFNEAPEWFRDAKLGIYFHWGVYTVPAYGSEWYPRLMHLKGHRVYRYHLQKYGGPEKFPYHKFIPMFRAEHFDPDQWADLFVRAGAKFAGPVAEHHDGFSMWASQVNPWNAGKMGPKRDVVGELEKAIRSRGLKFVTTFHHARRRNWYPRVKGWATTSTDPMLRMLYANLPDDLCDRLWLAKLGEVIDWYHPDLIWFDGRLEDVAEPYHLRFLACYLNGAANWGKEVVVTTKGHDFPPEVSIEDFEKGRLDRLTDYAWLTDDTISTGSWGYTQNLRIKPPHRVLHDFIDIVSKNGCLLLNISPRSDGIIPQNQQEVLLELGKWLKINGEAIYCTRPWFTFGEGPTRLQRGGHFVRGVEYTSKDIRYTRSQDGRTLYAIVLGWPQERELTLTSLLVHKAAPGRVQLLGFDRPLPFRVNEHKQLVVQWPQVEASTLPSKYAYVLKLTEFHFGLHPVAAKEIAQRTAARGKRK